MNKNSYGTHENSQDTIRWNKKRVVALAASFAISIGIGGYKAHEWITHKEKIATDTYDYSPSSNGDIAQLNETASDLAKSVGVNPSSISGIVYEGQTIGDEVAQSGDNSVTVELYEDRLGSVSVEATPTSELEADEK